MAAGIGAVSMFFIRKSGTQERKGKPDIGIFPVPEFLIS